MDDLKRILDINRSCYKRFALDVPVFDELIVGFRWIMTADISGNMSLALRAVPALDLELYEKTAKNLYGKPVDLCIERLLEENDVRLRNLIVSLSCLMSKPLNNVKLLARRGIFRTEGLNFNYPTEGKKIGLIGFGVYISRFLNRCGEFHVFDLRPPEQILSYRCKDGLRCYPDGILWHLGRNAVEFADLLAELDIVIMTGSTIVNDSYVKLLKACKNASIIGIYGPSCELCPDYLFDIGFNYIFSTSLADKEKYLKAALGPDQSYKEFDYMNIYELEKKFD
ncbi:Rossmann-like domain-containing protein [Treponema parvum]|uniref:Rossmann-like domain-containing protein n=1 Tax=Treponema parvum TaxID=138851 RepID=UPI001AEBB19E|nr:DUF364 domain-containing protein [Treponema parvum]QTQ16502.1 hypothetical protein HXT04_07265 [Treponema parvum]